MDADDFRRIRYIAKSYAKKCERITEDDLFQIGVMAYIEGIDKWDPLKGKKWDYMWLVVAGKIAGYARDRESLIYIPQNVHKYVSYDFLDIDDFDILGEDKGLNAVEDVLFRARLCSRCLALLTPRERFVIIERYGLYDDDPKTLEQVGNEIGVTRERVRQVEAKALRKMHGVIRREHIEREDVFDD